MISTSSAGISSRDSREQRWTSATPLSRKRRAGRVERDLPQHGAANVVGHVAAADHDHAPSEGWRVPERDVAQELDAAEHAGGIRAGDRERAGALRADGDHDGVMARPQLGELHVLADLAIRHRPHAELENDVDLRADQVARQPVLGDADGEHPGEHRLHLVDRHVEAEEREVVGRRRDPPARCR